MFYCYECAEKNDWPKFDVDNLSFGTCECCDKKGVPCNDLHHSKLKPIVRDEELPLEDDEFSSWDDDPGYW